MQPIHEGGVASHLRRKWRQQVSDPLLVLDVHIEVADQDDATVSANAFAAAAELAGLHVSLHDVDTVLLVEGDAGYFVKADDVVLGDETALTSCVVDKHSGHGRLAPGDQVRVRR